MKITIKHYASEVTWSNDKENQQIDETSIDEAFLAFKGLLVTCGWNAETVDGYILEWASIIESDKNGD